MSEGLFPGTLLPEESFMVIVGMPGKTAFYLRPSTFVASSDVNEAGMWPENVARQIRDELDERIRRAQEPEWVWIDPLVSTKQVLANS